MNIMLTAIQTVRLSSLLEYLTPVLTRSGDICVGLQDRRRKAVRHALMRGALGV